MKPCMIWRWNVLRLIKMSRPEVCGSILVGICTRTHILSHTLHQECLDRTLVTYTAFWGLDGGRVLEKYRLVQPWPVTHDLLTHNIMLKLGITFISSTTYLWWHYCFFTDKILTPTHSIGATRNWNIDGIVSFILKFWFVLRAYQLSLMLKE